MNDYASQSKMSHPGQYAHFYDDLPQDIDALHRVVNNIFIHIWKMQKINLPDERKADFATRRIEDVLKRVMAYDDSSLTKQRPRSKQFIGDCRHSALLLCSMLRHQGIPARVRNGFCQYISSDQQKYMHHVITEYWDGERWILDDPDIIRHDIPREEFLFGAQVWQMYRADKLNPEQFFIAEGVQGDWIFPLPMLRDLASLAKYELTSSDMWGIIAPDFQLTDDEQKMLDDVASLMMQANDLESIQQIFEKYPTLKIHPPMFGWDWVTNDMIEFDISDEIG